MRKLWILFILFTTLVAHIQAQDGDSLPNERPARFDSVRKDGDTLVYMQGGQPVAKRGISQTEKASGYDMMDSADIARLERVKASNSSLSAKTSVDEGIILNDYYVTYYDERGQQVSRVEIDKSKYKEWENDPEALQEQAQKFGSDVGDLRFNREVQETNQLYETTGEKDLNREMEESLRRQEQMEQKDRSIEERMQSQRESGNPYIEDYESKYEQLQTKRNNIEDKTAKIDENREELSRLRERARRIKESDYLDSDEKQQMLQGIKQESQQYTEEIKSLNEDRLQSYRLSNELRNDLSEDIGYAAQRLKGEREFKQYEDAFNEYKEVQREMGEAKSDVRRNEQEANRLLNESVRLDEQATEAILSGDTKRANELFQESAKKKTEALSARAKAEVGKRRLRQLESDEKQAFQSISNSGGMLNAYVQRAASQMRMPEQSDSERIPQSYSQYLFKNMFITLHKDAPKYRDIFVLLSTVIITYSMIVAFRDNSEIEGLMRQLATGLIAMMAIFFIPQLSTGGMNLGRDIAGAMSKGSVAHMTSEISGMMENLDKYGDTPKGEAQWRVDQAQEKLDNIHKELIAEGGEYEEALGGNADDAYLPKPLARWADRSFFLGGDMLRTYIEYDDKTEAAYADLGEKTLRNLTSEVDGTQYFVINVETETVDVDGQEVFRWDEGSESALLSWDSVNAMRSASLSTPPSGENKKNGGKSEGSWIPGVNELEQTVQKVQYMIKWYLVMGSLWVLLGLFHFLGAAAVLFETFQQFLIVASSIILPLFIAGMSTDILKQQSQTTIWSTIGLFFWPVGWALGHLGTLSLWESAKDNMKGTMLDPLARSDETIDVLQGLSEMSAVAFFFLSLQLLGVFAFGLIVTFTAPFVMQKVIVGGGSFFAPMLGGALSLGARAAGSAAVMGSKGVGTAVSASAQAGGAVVSGAGSAVGTTLGSRGGALGSLGRGMGSTLEKAGGIVGASGKSAGDAASRTSFAAGRTMLNAAQSWSPDNPRSFAQVPDVAWDERRGVRSEQAEIDLNQYMQKQQQPNKGGGQQPGKGGGKKDQ